MLRKILFVFLFITHAFAFEVKNESELSIIQTTGNTEVSTYNAKTKTTLEFEKYITTLGGHYFLSFYQDEDENGDNVNIESAKNWDYYAKLERTLTKKVNGFVQVQIEGDKFSGYTQRNNHDFGGKFKFIQTKKKSFFSELGLRYTVEYKDDVDQDEDGIKKSNKGRVYFEFSESLNETLSYKLWLEYLPNFTEGDDYMINYEPSLSVLLSNTFSLKLSYNSAYDNVPADSENEKHDIKYTTSLIARY